MNSLIWLMGAGILGFFLSELFSNYFKLSRRLFLIPYFTLTIAFLIGFFLVNRIEFGKLFIEQWQVGMLTGIIVGAFLAKTVFARPASRKITGLNYTFDLIWAGLVYGIVDGLFLNVMPVLAVRLAFPLPVWRDPFLARVVVAALALGASLLVCILYHLGYSEFRNNSMRFVILGNAIITLSFIVSGNPLAAVLSHAIMHVAAVIRGSETAIQLPPHRQPV